MDTDYIWVITEEVALEGLDGITLQALWVRLKNRPSFPMTLDNQSKEFLWKCLMKISDFEFYELDTPRGELSVQHQAIFMDPDTGVSVDFEIREDLYPIDIIDDGINMGSCSTYKTRKKVTEHIKDEEDRAKMTLSQVEERFGMRLVIVASQDQRHLALCGEEFDRSFVYSLTNVAYCILERIARTRRTGEMSVGENSLQVFKIPPKSMFYHTLKLIKLGLVKKQVLSVFHHPGQNMLRRLFHLTRFYQQYQSKYMILSDMVEKYIKGLPGQRQELHKTRLDCGIDQKSFKKLYQTCYKKFKVSSILYREMYPNATEAEYLSKKKDYEKLVRVIELRENVEESEEEDEDDEKIEKVSQDLVPTEYVFEKSLLRQGWEAVVNAGPEGTSLGQLMHKMNLTYFESRLILRKLEKHGFTFTILQEDGKQKRQRHVSKKFLQENKLVEEILVEKKKLKSSLKKLNAKDTEPEPVELVETQGTELEKTKVVEEIHAPQPVMQKNEGVDDDVRKIMGSINKKRSKKAAKSVKTTGRQMKRINWILEFVREQRIVDGVFNILKDIRLKEKEENFEYMMDKKSVVRLVQLLTKEGKINSIKTMIEAGNKQKELLLVTAADITPDNPIVQCLINQAQVKLGSVKKECLKNQLNQGQVVLHHSEKNMEKIPETARESIRKLMMYRSNLKADDMVYDTTALKDYNYRPKFSRAEIVHHLLWYLIHECKEPTESSIDIVKQQDVTSEVKTGEVDITDNTVVTSEEKQDSGSEGQGHEQAAEHGTEVKYTEEEKHAAGNGSQITEQEDVKQESDFDPDKFDEEEDIIKQLERIPKPKVYKDELTWKKYLSPLPKHAGYGIGWVLVSDVLLQLPVSVFCLIFHIPYKIKGLKELLQDPDKCLYPVLSLPVRLIQQLLYARKYIYSFYDTCKVLCQFGLLSFGPHIMKEKDKVFLYLHEHASLVDTKGSAPGFTQVRLAEKPHITKYSFTREDDLIQYWVDLKHICFNSNLGSSNMKEHEEDDKGNSLRVAYVNKNVDEIIDDGTIPGNGKGAAGMDSSLFMHLQRNWKTGLNPKSHKKYAEKRTQIREAAKEAKKEKKRTSAAAPTYESKRPKKSDIRAVIELPKERLALTNKDKSAVVKIKLTTNTKGNRGGKGVKRKSADTKTELPANKKRKAALQKLKKIKPKLRKFVYDEMDIIAYNKKLTQRVSWTPHEDSLLLTCKIASLVMDRKRRGMLVPWSCARDVLHKYAPKESVDKTSCACQRRVTHSLKTPLTKHSLMIFYSEAMQDKLVKEFSERDYFQGTEAAKAQFRELVDHLVQKFSNVKLQKVILPDSLCKLTDYTITTVSHYNLKKRVSIEEPKIRAEILQHSLENIIHSFVSSTYDKHGRTHQMFRLLSQYPETILDKAIARLRAEGVIVRQKRRNDEVSEALETGMKNIKLSQRYEYRFHSRYPTTIFENTFGFLRELTDSTFQTDPETMKLTDITNGGVCATVIMLLLTRKLSVHIDIPADVVILDTSYKIGRGFVPKPIKKGSILDEESDSDEELPLTLDEKEQRSKLLAQTKEWMMKRVEPSQFVFDNDGKTVLQYKTSDKSCLKFQNEEMTPEFLKVKEKIAAKASTCASRALVTMRRSRAEQAVELKHFNVQDNFLIQACDLGMNVLKEKEGISDTSKSTLLHVLENSYSTEKSKRILKRIQSFLPFELDLNEVWNSVDPTLLPKIKEMYNIINSAGELGICKFQLKRLVNDWEIYQKGLALLMEKKAVCILSGYEDPVFVGQGIVDLRRVEIEKQSENTCPIWLIT